MQKFLMFKIMALINTDQNYFIVFLLTHKMKIFGFFAYSKVKINVKGICKEDVRKINLVCKNINLLQLMIYY